MHDYSLKVHQDINNKTRYIKNNLLAFMLLDSQIFLFFCFEIMAHSEILNDFYFLTAVIYVLNLLSVSYIFC